jgi:hypothetical protein
MVDAWNETGIGQVMAERVGLDAIANYGVADTGGQSEDFKFTLRTLERLELSAVIIED